MIAFPHAKINLGLSIVSKRPDGFHNLETIFYPLPLRDVIEIVSSEEDRFILTGLKISGNESDNLVLRAYHQLRKKYPQITPIEIHLHKAIPAGAGMGGGSSDAAKIIHLIDRFFRLNIPPGQLFENAFELGSDCTFFMQSASCFASGRGEILEPVTLDLSAYSLLLVHPEIHINTAWAFSKIKPSFPRYNLKESIQEPIHNWVKSIHNDFEKPVFESYPQLRKIKNQLYDSGALYASMTGSGSTIFGIFNKSALKEIVVENASQRIIR
jgi:4-diphosphocytidyl-2-C-methyl-D-erythritol kinase